MKKIVFGIGIFLFSLFVLDSILSFFLEKDIYVLMQKRIEITPGEKSAKQVDWAEKVRSVSGVPIWNTEYRGPFFYTSPKKTRNCRILGIGDSIMYGSGVFSNETYMYYMSQMLKNTEVINLAVPGYDAMQEIYTIEHTNLINETDVILWHFWEDDGHVYSYVNGILYNSHVVLNDYGYPQLFSIIPPKFNSFLIRRSYLYNETLKLQMKVATLKEISGSDMTMIKLDEFFANFRSTFPNKKIIILFSPSLNNDNYTFPYNNPLEEPEIYGKIKTVFEKYENVNFVNLKDFLKGIPVKDVRYDTFCHFNEYGNQVVSKGLIEFIKSKKLLDENCF